MNFYDVDKLMKQLKEIKRNGFATIGDITLQQILEVAKKHK